METLRRHVSGAGSAGMGLRGLAAERSFFTALEAATAPWLAKAS